MTAPGAEHDLLGVVGHELSGFRLPMGALVTVDRLDYPAGSVVVNLQVPRQPLCREPNSGREVLFTGANITKGTEMATDRFTLLPDFYQHNRAEFARFIHDRLIRFFGQSIVRED